MTIGPVVAIDPGRKNLAMCLVDADAKILKWTVLDVVPSAAGLARALGDMDFEGWARLATAAVIERQPHKNPSMKMMQHYLEMACALHGLRVSTLDPKLKLAAAQASPWWPTRDIPDWTYAQRKKLAVDTVAAMLADGRAGDFGDFWAGSKKKDDLADAFLTALAFYQTPPRETVYVRGFKARKPTDAQIKSGRFTQAALKHLAKGVLTSRETFEAGTRDVRGFETSAIRHFGSMANAYVQLGGQ